MLSGQAHKYPPLNMEKIFPSAPRNEKLMTTLDGEVGCEYFPFMKPSGCREQERSLVTTYTHTYVRTYTQGPRCACMYVFYFN